MTKTKQAAKHTPGPWKYRKLKGSERTFSSADEYEVNDSSLGDSRMFIADCGAHCHSLANAILISQAPALLQAARRGISALAANGAPNCEAAKELRAAIALAEGRPKEVKK